MLALELSLKLAVAFLAAIASVSAVEHKGGNSVLHVAGDFFASFLSFLAILRRRFGGTGVGCGSEGSVKEIGCASMFGFRCGIRHKLVETVKESNLHSRPAKLESGVERVATSSLRQPTRSAA